MQFIGYNGAIDIESKYSSPAAPSSYSYDNPLDFKHVDIPKILLKIDGLQKKERAKKRKKRARREAQEEIEKEFKLKIVG